MDNSNGIYALIIAPLLGAISWLAKKLYDAPRPDEYKRVLDDCDKLKIIVDAAVEERRQSLAETEAANRKLEAKIARMEAAAARIGRTVE